MTSPSPHRLEWSPEHIQKFWDFQSEHSTQYFASQVGRALITYVRPVLRKARTILDYGCGPGFLIAELLRQGYSDVWGTDLSEQSLRLVEKRFQTQRGFGGAKPVKVLLSTHRSFDALFILEVIEHLNEDALDNLLKDSRALLSEAGRIIITTPNQEDLNAGDVFCPNCDLIFHRMQHVRSWTPAGLTEFLERRGFRVLHVSTTDLSALQRAWVPRLLFYLKKVLCKAQLPNLICVAEQLPEIITSQKKD